LISPDGTAKCDCGFEFNAPADLLWEDLLAARRSAVGGIVSGVLVAAGAIAASIGWSMANEGSALFYGAIVAGFIWAGISLRKLDRVKQAMREQKTRA